MSKAAMLSPQDEIKLFDYLKTTRYPVRDRLIFALSIKAGLRVGEISKMTWKMVLDGCSEVRDFILIPNAITKGTIGEREIPIGHFLRDCINDYKKITPVVMNRFLILNQRGVPYGANSLAVTLRLHYHNINLKNCSSHSGRRSFITNTARKISLCGGSLQDVRMFAGHRWITTTQVYIDGNREAQRNVVNMI